MTVNFLFPNHSLWIVMSFSTLCLALLLAVVTTAILKNRRIKAQGWFMKFGFSLEAGNDDEPPKLR